MGSGLGLAAGPGGAEAGAKDPGFSSPLELGEASQKGAKKAIEAWFLQERPYLVAAADIVKYMKLPKSDHPNVLVDPLGLELLKL